MGQTMSHLCGKERAGKGQLTFDEVERSPPGHTSNTNTDNNNNDNEDQLFSGLTEVSGPPPVQNRDDSAHTYSHHTLEEAMRNGDRR